MTWLGTLLLRCYAWLYFRRARRVVRKILPKLRTVPIAAVHDNCLTFEVSGKAGEVKYATARSAWLFRGERLFAVDDSDSMGLATAIERIEVGTRPQITPPPNGSGIMSKTFGAGSIGVRHAYDTCKPGESIVYAIRFFDDCTWHGALFGRSVR